MRGPQNTNITREKIEKMYINDPNASLESVANQLGVHRETLRRWVRALDLKVKPKSRPGRTRKGNDTRLSNQEWLTEQLKDKTGVQLANELGVNKQIVWFWAKRFGLMDEDKSIAIKDALRKRYPNGRSGTDASNWRGGRRKMSSGYIYVYCPDHPHATKTGCVFEHVLLAEKKIGRYMRKNEIVHHINGDKNDNSPENLLVCTRAEHTAIHMEAVKEVFRLRKILDEHGIKY